MMSRFARLQTIGRGLVRAAAGLFLLQCVLVVSGPPRWLVRWLTAADLAPRGRPEIIVVLGGGGIPSESGLIRCYYAAQFGAGRTGLTYVVSLPADKDPETNSVGRMRDELVLRGVAPAQIRMESRGLDTHDQAVRTLALLGETARRRPLVVVTSGYHLRRAILAFRAVGFTDVAGLNAVSIGAEADFGMFTWLRYGLWNNLAREAEIVRELIALGWYKFRGWA